MGRLGLKKPIVVLDTTDFERRPILWQLGGEADSVGRDGHT